MLSWTQPLARPWHGSARSLQRAQPSRRAPGYAWPIGGVRGASATDKFRFVSRDEERVVKTTLHELGTQGETMKLSLKVYHFQELSRTSLRDSSLRRDERYEALKADLVAQVSDLSPAQLVAAMVSSGRLKINSSPFWWHLARGVERHVLGTKSGLPGLQHSQICLVLHAMGRAKIKVKLRFYQRMLRHMLNHATLWSEWDMAWVLYAMRKRRLKPFREENLQHQLWAKVLKNIAAVFRQKLHLTSPRGIVFILYEFSRHQVYPGEVMFAAARRLSKHMSSLNDRSLVALASMLGTFDWPEVRLLKRLSKQVREPQTFVRLHPIMFVVIIHAFAKLRVRDIDLLEAVCTLFARSCEGLDPRSRATLAYSLGKLGVRGPVWSTLCARIQEKIGTHPPLHLALIAHACGKVGVDDVPLLTEGVLSDAALESLKGFRPKDVACLLDGLTLTGHLSEELFRAAFDWYISLGTVGGNQRTQMMNRILFSVVLERPSFLSDAPTAWRTTLARVRTDLQPMEERPYHTTLEDAARALGLTPDGANATRTLRRKGLYTVDLHVAPRKSDGESLALHLVADAEVCPLTGELLGPTRLRQRHLGMMRWTYVGMGRKEWLALPTAEARVDALEALLSRYVPTERQLEASPQTAALLEATAALEADTVVRAAALADKDERVLLP
eukprot:TRINITY_DN38229_c0_g1_i1.p1 TRINITY_DN38229_c0_g1~~TRINITY_DN38229_c0_g1_i1.p1  ORF type:complete len:680 (+),score=91.88 TRINITY_DN38229_c0_g1_i1:25-2040(+)